MSGSRDTNHPFFRPLWRRVVATAVPWLWAVFEHLSGNPGWAVLFAALGAYGVWAFFIAWKGPDADGGNGDEGEGDNR